MVKESNTRKLEMRARVFKALAHPTRLRLLEALMEREHCVCELVDLGGADPSTISKHLTLMKAAGVVDCDKRGTMVFYSLKMKCVPGFLSCVDNAILSLAREQIKEIS